MFDFDVIPNQAVIPPGMGNRLFYRALFPAGLCMLVLSIRPADARVVWLINVVLALAFLLISPVLLYLSVIWYGPENTAEFGVGRGAARIFNGGDAIYGTSYLILGVASLASAAYLLWPVAQTRCALRKTPPRVILLRLWSVLRVLLLTISLVLLLQDAQVAARNPRYFNSSTFAAQMVMVASCALFAAVVTPPNRRRVRSFLGRVSARQEVRALAAVSTIIGSSQPKVAVDVAAKAFRGLPFDKMSREDWLTNKDTGLNKHCVPLKPGKCDAFVTHSWSDDGNAKWTHLVQWRDEFVAKGGGSNPIVWLDKACLDQGDIKGSLAGLPMYVAWSNTLLLLASSSYVKRLWCIIELFTWVQMGCPIERIQVIDLDGGAALDEDLVKFSVSKAKCFVTFDKHRLLAVVENAFGDHSSFDTLVRDIVQHRRGRESTTRSTKTSKRLMELSNNSFNAKGGAPGAAPDAAAVLDC